MKPAGSDTTPDAGAGQVRRRRMRRSWFLAASVAVAIGLSGCYVAPVAPPTVVVRPAGRACWHPGWWGPWGWHPGHWGGCP